MLSTSNRTAVFLVALGLGASSAQANLAGADHPPIAAARHVTTERVRLLTAQDELQSRTTVADIVKFIKSAEEKAYPILATNPAPARVRVQFDCQPRHCAVELSVQGDPQQPVLDTLFEAMKALEPLETIGEASFQVQYRIGE